VGRGGPQSSPYHDLEEERRPLKRDFRREDEYQTLDYPNYRDDDEDKAQEIGSIQRLIFILTRLIAWACSGLIILVGVSQWSEYITLENLHISTYIVASYLIFFGLVFILCELCDWGIRSSFGFLFTYSGRGLAYIFCGSLAFGMDNERYWPLGPAAGFALLGVGGVLFVVSFLFSHLPPLDPWCYSSVSRVKEDDEERNYNSKDY
jgi:hypothetical protein